MKITKPLRFSVSCINHGHIYSLVNTLLNAGGVLVDFYSKEKDLAEKFAGCYPQARQVKSEKEILEDPSISVVVSAGIPCDRAPLGIRVMEHGKDYLVDKPGFTTLKQLAEARRVQKKTGRIYSVCYSERMESRASTKAGEIIKAGAIGRVVSTAGFGPHKIGVKGRPDWFFKKAKYGGILADIASHQMDQFLYYTGSTKAEVVYSAVANYKYPEFPELEDFGECMLKGDKGTGYVRVDWYTPDGLPTWGDGRLTILGTEGYIECRKYIDIAGKKGGEHLFLVNKKEVKYIDCNKVPLPFGKNLVYDIKHRTETAMSQAHCFLASELALKAEANAVRLTTI
ncbi:MAG: oxidoreductase [Candidatus Firestonebacteria bacterium RIFOXYA2_FULL_40_8]|nr:MAG: oxidoreductase [Candidatus Firestonebacteria bacterium RIFOXYA2_FULL_40_8]